MINVTHDEFYQRLHSWAEREYLKGLERDARVNDLSPEEELLKCRKFTNEREENDQDR